MEYFKIFNMETLKPKIEPKPKMFYTPNSASNYLRILGFAMFYLQC